MIFRTRTISGCTPHKRKQFFSFSRALYHYHNAALAKGGGRTIRKITTTAAQLLECCFGYFSSCMFLLSSKLLWGPDKCLISSGRDSNDSGQKQQLNRLPFPSFEDITFR